MSEIHLPCPIDGCNGSIVFIGLKGYEKWFKCCICQKEFPNRRKLKRRSSSDLQDRRKLWGGGNEITD
jgi:hypothetical protein